jgi:hypothetical protein
MKAEKLNVTDRKMSFRDREATLARLVAELEALKKLVHLEEMKLAGELTASTAKQARHIGTDPASGD